MRSLKQEIPYKLKQLIKQYSKNLPDWIVQNGKRLYHKVRLRSRAVSLNRRIIKGYRIVFPCAEVADYEKFEMLSAGPGEAVIRPEFTIVSTGTERAYLLSLPGAARPFPVNPGYSGAGVVMSVGRGVTSVSVGERVAGRIGHASVATVQCDRLFRIPSDVPSDSAALIELGIIVLQGIRKAKILPGESVLVVGLGIIGQLVCRIAKCFGASPVIALARSRTKVSLRLNANTVDRFVLIEDLESEKLDFDVIIEASGDASCLSSVCNFAKPGGRIILLGSSRGISTIDFSRDIASRGIMLVGAHITGMPKSERSSHFWTYRDEGQLFLRWLSEERIMVDDLLKEKIDPAQADIFYRRLAIRDSRIVTGCFDWRTFSPASRLSRNMLMEKCLPSGMNT